LLVTDYGGGFYRLVPSPGPERAAPFPTLLSETGLFASTREHRPDPALIPYAVNAPGWNDGAEAERFLAVPGGSKVGFDAGRGWSFPDGTALVQTLTLGREPGHPASRVRVETRVLLRQQGEWAGYSYRWTPTSPTRRSWARAAPTPRSCSRAKADRAGPGDSPAGPSAWRATAARRTSCSASPGRS
jgi:hypothetical protein